MRILILIFLVCSSIVELAAQVPAFEGAREKYILYNGEPYLALLEADGKIVELVREAPELYKYFSKADIKAIKEYYGDKNTVFNSSQNRPVQSSSSTGIAFSADEAVSFGFSPFRARLNDSQISSLRSLAKSFKRGEISSISIISYLYEKGEVGSKLAQNRMEACRDLLYVFGVSESSVYTEISSDAVNSPTVKIYAQ